MIGTETYLRCRSDFPFNRCLCYMLMNAKVYFVTLVPKQTVSKCCVTTKRRIIKESSDRQINLV